MITNKISFNPNGFSEIVSYQDLKRPESIERLENDYWPLKRETLFYLAELMKDENIFPKTKYNKISVMSPGGDINKYGWNLWHIFEFLRTKFKDDKDYPCNNRNYGLVWEKWITYMITTMLIETGGTYDWTAEEKGSDDYLKGRYDKNENGNKQGTKDYYNFRGRSLPQTTWRGNYIKIEAKIWEKVGQNPFAMEEKDITTNKLYNWSDFWFTDPTGTTEYRTKDGQLIIKRPNRELDSIYCKKVNDFVPSCYILSYGMLEGWFTSKKMTSYLNSNKTDFLNARKVIIGWSKESSEAYKKAKEGEIISNEIYKVIKQYSGL